jgi:hypothetical protein
MSVPLCGSPERCFTRVGSSLISSVTATKIIYTVAAVRRRPPDDVAGRRRKRRPRRPRKARARVPTFRRRSSGANGLNQGILKEEVSLYRWPPV